MKVMFIYTDIGISVGYSCGIGALSAYLKRHGHQTRLVHVSEELGYSLDLDRIMKDIREFSPQLIAFSAMTNQWFFVKQVASHIRRHLDTPVVVGGHHANAAPLEVISEPYVDYACKGEGEVPLLELVTRLESGRPTFDIPNILTKRRGLPGEPPLEVGDNGIIENPMGRWIQQLDDLPFEDRDVFQYDAIVRSRHGWAEVIATRGCPYACTYCFNTPFFQQYERDLKGTPDEVRRKDYVRRRSMDSTLGMLREVKERFPNVKYFTFVDDVFAVDADWLAQLAPRYIREIGMPFACTSQPLAFNEDIARLLKQMGCKVVKMGVEAGNPRIRSVILNRKVSDQVLIDAFDLARRYGLDPQSFNMMGLPTETKENMLETVRLNARLRAYIVWVATFMPYPGTSLSDFCVANDLIDSRRWDDVHSYRGGSVLKEVSFSYLDLENMRVLFKWQLNAALGNDCSAEYQRNIDELEAMSPDDWFGGKVEDIYKVRDQELDDRFRRAEVDHYITKKYMNMFWAREYDFDIT